MLAFAITEPEASTSYEDRAPYPLRDGREEVREHYDTGYERSAPAVEGLSDGYAATKRSGPTYRSSRASSGMTGRKKLSVSSSNRVMCITTRFSCGSHPIALQEPFSGGRIPW